MMRLHNIIKGVIWFALLAVLCAAPASAFNDPLAIGIGARPIALGKAYTAVAEGAESMFLNPAGISQATRPQVTSMNGNLMGEIGYLVLGGSMPLEGGQSIGLGIVNAGSSGITLRDESGTVMGSSDYNTAVYFVSYAMDLEQTSFKNKDLYFGTSLKIFSQTITGHDSVHDGNGSGIDLDVGLLYKAKPWLTLGLTQQNIMPASMGGSMTFVNGYSEGIPTVTKLGSKFNLLGAENKAVWKSEYDLTLAVDTDFYPTSSRATAWHTGLELWPAKFLALRVGYDHDAVDGGSTVPYLTSGVGLSYKGFQFDYAYHPFSDQYQNATHFFSFAYVGEDEPIIVVEPTPEARKIALKHFIDVPDGYWAKDAIEYSATAGIVNGYPDGTFRPDSPISRAELATLLVRVKDLELQKAYANVFKDLKPSHWASQYVLAAKSANLLNGYPNGTFKPARKITRAEGTTLFARFEQLKYNDYIVDRPFPDVNLGHWGIKEIDAAKDYGFLKYLESMYFRANRQMSRAEAVAMLSKTTLAKLKIDEFFGYEVSIYEGPYPFKDYYVAGAEYKGSKKTKTIAKKDYKKKVSNKTAPASSKKTASALQKKYAQAKANRMKKIKTYLKDTRGVYVTGTTKIPTSTGKRMQVYILSDGKFMTVEDTGKTLHSVSIYDPVTGKWSPVSVDAVASLN